MGPVPGTADFYDREAARYDDLRWQSAAGAYTDATQKAIVAQLLGDIQDQPVLEIGAGTGRFTAQLIAGGAQVTALDLSLQMLRQEQDARSGDCIRVQADAGSLPFPEQQFKGCLSINVFSHVRHYRAALKEVARVLRPGGFLVVNIPNLWSYYLPAGLIVNARRRALRRNVYTHWYTLRSFDMACRQAGLRTEQVVGQLHLKDALTRIGLLGAGLKRIDQLSRSSVLRYFCPNVYFRVERTGGVHPLNSRS